MLSRSLALFVRSGRRNVPQRGSPAWSLSAVGRIIRRRAAAFSSRLFSPFLLPLPEQPALPAVSSICLDCPTHPSPPQSSKSRRCSPSPMPLRPLLEMGISVCSTNHLKAVEIIAHQRSFLLSINNSIASASKSPKSALKMECSARA